MGSLPPGLFLKEGILQQAPSSSFKRKKGLAAYTFLLIDTLGSYSSSLLAAKGSVLLDFNFRQTSVAIERETSQFRKTYAKKTSTVFCNRNGRLFLSLRAKHSFPVDSTKEIIRWYHETINHATTPRKFLLGLIIESKAANPYISFSTCYLSFSPEQDKKG